MNPLNRQVVCATNATEWKPVDYTLRIGLKNLKNLIKMDMLVIVTKLKNLQSKA